MTSVRPAVHRLPAIGRRRGLVRGPTHHALTRSAAARRGPCDAGLTAASANASAPSVVNGGLGEGLGVGVGGGGVGGIGGERGGGGDRRTIRGVGTFLIDTPKDSASPYRQRVLSFQEQHRGGLTKLQDEPLPEIPTPFRLNPRPDSNTTQVMSKPPTAPAPLMVDAATSPMLPDIEGSNPEPSRSSSAATSSSSAKSVTFRIDPEMTSRRTTKEMTSQTKPGGTSRTQQEVTSSQTQEMTSRSPRGGGGGEEGEGGGGGGGGETSRWRTLSVLMKKSTSSSTSSSLSHPATQNSGSGPVSVARSVSFSERPRRRTPPKRTPTGTTHRECSLKARNTFSSSGEGTPSTVAIHNTTTTTTTTETLPLFADMTAPSATSPGMMMMMMGVGGTERLPTLPGTARTPRSGRRKSASASDLTDVASIFSWHDRDFEIKTSRSVDLDPEFVGPTSYTFQGGKSHSLLDLLRPSTFGGVDRGEGLGWTGGAAAEDEDAAYHNRQRIAHLAFRKDNNNNNNSHWSTNNNAGRGGGGGTDGADREWLDMVNAGPVVDTADYERYASRRKPSHPAAAASSSTKTKPYSPAAPANFRINHKVHGKGYPVFFNDGTPVRKLGRAVYSRKLSKHKHK